MEKEIHLLSYFSKDFSSLFLQGGCLNSYFQIFYSVSAPRLQQSEVNLTFLDSDAW